MSFQRYPMNPGEELSGTAGKDFVARGGDERAVGRVGLEPHDPGIMRSPALSFMQTPRFPRDTGLSALPKEPNTRL
jgi:hypothetical protein